MKSVFALIPAAIVAGGLMSAPAMAKCQDHDACSIKRVKVKTSEAKATPKTKVKAKHHASSTRKATVKAKHHASNTRKAKVRHVKSRRTASHRYARKASSIRHARAQGSSGGEKVHGNVMAMIKSMSPGYGVPTWFALRIAKVESGYNPTLRGKAGEYGVFQIKCPTAKGLGFGGNCGQLADARTNIEWGLKHLSAALKSSGGNLRLAASKHNAGLGRKTIVKHYVGLVF